MQTDQTIADQQLQKTLLKLDHHYHQSKVWRARCIYVSLAALTLLVALVWMCAIWPR